MEELVVISTPIGNSKDISLHGIERFRSLKYIACEDTRVFRKLYREYLNDDTKLVAYHDFNEAHQVNNIINLLQHSSVGIVSDAGTPLMCDPGYRLIQRCIQNNISIKFAPGPCSIIPALIYSGFPPFPFTFMGFTPRKGRVNYYNKVLNDIPHTCIFFESCHRIRKSIEDFKSIETSRDIAVIKDITKSYQNIYRGNPQQILDTLDEKGEFIIVIGCIH